MVVLPPFAHCWSFEYKNPVIHLSNLFEVTCASHGFWGAAAKVMFICATCYFFLFGRYNSESLVQDRPSTKVHAAPGGGSSLNYLFGGNGNWWFSCCLKQRECQIVVLPLTICLLRMPFISCVPNGQYLQIVVGKNSFYVWYGFMWEMFWFRFAWPSDWFWDEKTCNQSLWSDWLKSNYGCFIFWGPSEITWDSVSRWIIHLL